MKYLPVAAAAALLTLAACDQPKPRSAPDAAPPAAQTPAAATPVAAPAPKPAAPPIAPSAVGMPKHEGVAGFYVDYVATAPDPLNKQPAVIAAGQPVTIGGFGFDAVTKQAAKGVDLVIDGKAYGVTYGSPRADVAAFYKTPALTNVGYGVTFPADSFAKGDHVIVVRVVSADGKSYQESVPVKFQVQ